jgi:hypothetical protein
MCEVLHAQELMKHAQAGTHSGLSQSHGCHSGDMSLRCLDDVACLMRESTALFVPSHTASLPSLCTADPRLRSTSSTCDERACASGGGQEIGYVRVEEWTEKKRAKVCV